ncbi:hypothetical protein HZC34_02955 [Candidatus Saganbacteria bacterium]|nr:hypothetical protein [Candidatus Saganbacteria bacterium]
MRPATWAIIGLCILSVPIAAEEIAKERLPYSKYEKVKIIASTYYAHLWSDTGRYRRVSKNGKRLGDFVALNFLPGGSVIMIPELFKTTTLEVADTFGGSGYTTFKGKKYWKVDILRNKNEFYDDFDYPLDMYIIKLNKCGAVKNKEVRQNCINFRSLGKGL